MSLAQFSSTPEHQPGIFFYLYELCNESSGRHPLCQSTPNLPAMECADKEEYFLVDFVWDTNLNIANFQYQPQQEIQPLVIHL